MRIIENRVNNEENDRFFPREVACENCGSIIEIDEDDVTEGYAALLYFRCPCCGDNSYIDIEDRVITADSFKFPEHFYHFNSGNVTEDELKQDVAEAIEYFRKNPDDAGGAVVLAGKELIVIKDWPGDENYSVYVSNDYYDLDIPYTVEDFRKEEGKHS